MASAQGLNKKTVFAKQSGLGVPATTGGTIMRRTSALFQLKKDTYESNEIVSHQQSTGSNHGIRKTSGKLDCLLSAGTQSLQTASLLRRDYAAVSAITGLSITVAGAGPTYTVTRATGSWLTDGVKAGDIGRLTAGGFNAANLNKNLLVISLTATILTVKPLNGVAMVAEGPIATSTWSTPGKKTFVPTTGHSNDYWSVEEFYSDLSKSELYTDVKIGKADVAIPATGNATISFDCPGLGRTRATAQQIVSPASETTTNVLTAVNGVVVVNGTVTSVTGVQFSINGNIQPGEAEIGGNGIGDHVRGEVAVSGQFMAKFSSTVVQDVFDQESVIKLFAVVTDGQTGTADFVCYVMSAIKVFGDDSDDGEAKEIIRTYPFTAQINSAGGAAVADLQTIISVQDSQA